MSFFSQGQDDFKHNLPMPREPVLKDESKATSAKVSPATGRVKPALPVKPALLDKHVNDKDQTLVKPKVVLPVRNQDPPINDASNSNESAISPMIMKTVLQRPMAKVGPSVRNDHVDENTDPKTVIHSEETARKCPTASNIIQGQVHAETEQASLGGDSDETLMKTAHTTSQQTFRKTSVERPTRSIQSLMPLQALEMSVHTENSNKNNSNNCKKEESCGRPLFQAPPFSMSRRSDATTLFYRNRPDLREQTDQFENSLDSLDETVAINNLMNFSDQSVRQRSLTPQLVPPGEDPLSRVQGRMNVSLLLLDLGTAV